MKIQKIDGWIEKYRYEVGSFPETKPVTWKGIDMTVEEAEMVIRELEQQKLKLQHSMNRVQTGGEITSIASTALGLTAMVTGVALMAFPPTAIAGAITITSGAGTAGIGKMVGRGVTKLGTNTNTQVIEQIDYYIDSLKEALRR
ncbi:hypothetical protein M595_1863 [Lyngbya aestuarii BL J]|uniref:Uncharacterized protein n=1 Tax=Lyngbya aestuarii BL J TaxID=1348334 RepID=U7QNV9_9CYAN|nr:hypothetical protein [Lyngbya aestuarii]ERT08086.1 hypothetical protein M595_1863 [Lyngbya aestuarii BL J]